MIYSNIYLFIINFIITAIFMPMLIYLVKSSKLVERNYTGVEIPNSMGLVYLFSTLISLGLSSLFFEYKNMYLYLFGLFSVGLLGLLDDAIGTDEFKGLKGHLGQFFRGKLTTGNIKALLGGFIALLISKELVSSFILTNGIIIALFINTANLIDLRPGRLSKFFLFISIIMIFISNINDYNYIIIGIWGIMVFYLNKDLKAKLMMGDTGSNILGYCLGYYSIASFNNTIKFIILVMLISLHIITERHSLTRIIENNRLLSFIDKLGR